MVVGSARVPLAVLAAIALGGCGSATVSGATTSTTTPMTPSAGSTPTSTIHPLPRVSACRAADLRFSVGSGGGAAGTFYWNLVVTNAGTQACTLRGYPAAVYVDKAGAPVGAVADHDESTPVTTVTLAHGAVASALVGAVDVFNYPPDVCKPVSVPGLVVSIPGDRHATAITQPGEACSKAGVSTLHVRAFVAGPGRQG